MTRERAKELFQTFWVLAWVINVVAWLTDPPDWARYAIGVAILALLCFWGLMWLRLAIRDGSLRRALPEYGWAFLSLLLIAVACGAVTAAGLAVAGEPLAEADVGSGATLGVFVVLAAWWLLRGRRRERPREAR